MAEVIRFGISADERLLERFDALIAEKGYVNRSEAVRDLIRNALVEEQWAAARTRPWARSRSCTTTTTSDLAEQAHGAPALAPPGDHLDAPHPPGRPPLPRGRRPARAGARDRAPGRRAHRHQGREARQVRGHHHRRRRGLSDAMSSLEEGPLRPRTARPARVLDTPVHRLDPRAKVVTTLVFLVCVVSFGKYDVAADAARSCSSRSSWRAEGGLPVGFLLRKARWRWRRSRCSSGCSTRCWTARSIADVGGVGDHRRLGVVRARSCCGSSSPPSRRSMLVATTGMPGVCSALERLGLPDVLATQMLLLYRYIFVLGEETMRMARARALRSLRQPRHGHACVRADARAPAAAHVRPRRARVPGDACAGLRRPHPRRPHAAVHRARRRLHARLVAPRSSLFRLYNVPLLLGRLLRG